MNAAAFRAPSGLPPVVKSPICLASLRCSSVKYVEHSPSLRLGPLAPAQFHSFRQPVRRSRSRLLMAAIATAFTVLTAAQPGWGGKGEDLSKALLTDSSFKVRVQAALLLGKLGEKAGTEALIKALDDENKSVRAMAAQSLGKLGGAPAAAALKSLLEREPDPFVATQIKVALSALEDQEVKDRKIFVTFGPFTGGAKAADSTLLALLHSSLQQSLAKLPKLTFAPDAPMPKGRARAGRVGFLIDGNVARLEESSSGSGGSAETSCEIKIMVARWPSRTVILWTSAGAAVQGGRRDADKLNARRDCIEATAGQLGDSLLEFFRSQGG